MLRNRPVGATTYCAFLTCWYYCSPKSVIMRKSESICVNLRPKKYQKARAQARCLESPGSLTPADQSIPVISLVHEYAVDLSLPSSEDSWSNSFLVMEFIML
jgi:hypothetical protein